jgi:hypothetical protein
MKSNAAAVDKLLELHLRELRDFYLVGPRSKLAKHELSAGEVEKLQAAFESDAAVFKRGRPPAHRTASERTFQSFQAFVFVAGELRIFRLRHGIERLPMKVQLAFVEFAKEMYTLAVDEIVLDNIRKHQRMIPEFDEPTCLELVRQEYEDGSVANVIVAGPADMRRL